MFKTSNSWDTWNVLPEVSPLCFEKTYAPDCKVNIVCEADDSATVYVNGVFYCGCRWVYFAKQIAEMYMYTHGGIQNEN